MLAIHAGLAGLAKAPELMIDPGSAKKLADAIVEVEKFYPVSVEPKFIALGNLALVAGSIYVPRVMAMAKRVRAENNEENHGFPSS